MQEFPVHTLLDTDALEAGDVSQAESVRRFLLLIHQSGHVLVQAMEGDDEELAQITTGVEDWEEAKARLTQPAYMVDGSSAIVARAWHLHANTNRHRAELQANPAIVTYAQWVPPERKCSVKTLRAIGLQVNTPVIVAGKCDPHSFQHPTEGPRSRMARRSRTPVHGHDAS